MEMFSAINKNKKIPAWVKVSRYFGQITIFAHELLRWGRLDRDTANQLELLAIRRSKLRPWRYASGYADELDSQYSADWVGRLNDELCVRWVRTGNCRTDYHGYGCSCPDDPPVLFTTTDGCVLSDQPC